MKLYLKPRLQKNELCLSEEMAAGLTEWLTGNQLEAAGITTYCLNS